MDDRYRTFILKYNLETGETNIGDLQDLYEEGWQLEMTSDEIVHKNTVIIFMHLIISHYKGATNG